MSNRRQNANSSTHGDKNLPTETALRVKYFIFIYVILS